MKSKLTKCVPLSPLVDKVINVRILGFDRRQCRNVLRGSHSSEQREIRPFLRRVCLVIGYPDVSDLEKCMLRG